jgi:hypothetical protein
MAMLGAIPGWRFIGVTPSIVVSDSLISRRPGNPVPMQASGPKSTA